MSLREFLASKKITMLDHLPYSSDFDPSDFSAPEDKGNIERNAF
jgi:hypothetical protein